MGRLVLIQCYRASVFRIGRQRPIKVFLLRKKIGGRLKIGVPVIQVREF